MHDTSKHVADHYQNLLMALPPVERLRRACNMFETAKSLALAAIERRLGPKASYRERMRQLWLQFYGPDFTQEQTERILARLDTHWSKQTG